MAEEGGTSVARKPYQAEDLRRIFIDGFAAIEMLWIAFGQYPVIGQAEKKMYIRVCLLIARDEMASLRDNFWPHYNATPDLISPRVDELTHQTLLRARQHIDIARSLLFAPVADQRKSS